MTDADEGARGISGTWALRRRGGLLPPLWGVTKRIDGSRGATHVGPLPGVPFDVQATESGARLAYRRPFRAFVDEVVQDADGTLRGRATFRGRTFGRFEMRRP